MKIHFINRIKLEYISSMGCFFGGDDGGYSGRTIKILVRDMLNFSLLFWLTFFR